jgi:hypothetical protein
MEAEYGHVLYYMGVRLFGCNRILKRVYGSKSEIELFLKTKGKHFRQLCDHCLMCDFVVCTDMNTT